MIIKKKQLKTIWQKLTQKQKKVLAGILSLLLIISVFAYIAVPFKARATDYTLSSNATWCDSDDLPSDIGTLTINSGVTLTIGGSSGNAVGGYKSGAPTDACSYSSTSIPVTITANLVVNGTLSVVGEYTTDMNGIAPTFTVSGDVTVAVTTGSISAAGFGYAATRGPGGGSSASYGSGGGYGGAGGIGWDGTAGGSSYGSAITPLDLGSGAKSVAGSGAIRIISSGTVTINGSVTANGVNDATAERSGSSGGSIYITAATLAGAGTITANGGQGMYGGGGGGGRIALYYSTANTYSGTPTVTGGTLTGQSGSGTAGSAGSVIIIDSTNRDLTVPTTLTLEPTSGVDLDGTARFDGVYNFRHVTVNSGATLTFKATYTTDMNGYGPTLKLTGNLTVTGSISAAGLGYAATRGPGGGSTASYGSGGGYGGAGGISQGGAAGGSSYGSALTPLDLGSGSGHKEGGGAIRIISSGTVTVNGSITANGQNYTGENNGGSGGSVYITAATLAGAGTITANGGQGYYGGGGGGGRIALYYSTANTYSGTPTVTGGTLISQSGSGTAGSVGTVTGPSQITVTNSLATPTLLSPNNSYTTNNTTPNFVWEPPIDYFGNISQYGLVIDSETEVVAYEPSYQWTTALGAGAHTWKVRAGDGTNWGAYTATYAFTVDTSSTANNLALTANTTFECDGDNYATLTTQSANNSGPYCVYTFDAVTIDNNVTITFNGYYTTYTLPVHNGRGVVLNAKSLSIASGSSISANTKGYLGGISGSRTGKGPGGGQNGGTSNAYNGGGGYGGAGGNSSVGGGSQPGGTAYGSATTPTDLGSGGGRDDAGGTDGGDGGGQVRLIVSGTTTISGSITANGEAATSTYGVGGGAGGSIYISSGVIAGAGSITANGGNGDETYGGGGAGGRVGLSYINSSTYSGTKTANGGSAINNGNPGNVFMIDSTNKDVTSSSSVKLFADKGNNLTGSVRTDGVYYFRNFTVTNNSTLTFGGIYSTYTLATHDGHGVTLNLTGDLTIDSGSSISANSQGYLGGISGSRTGKGPGGGQNGGSSNAYGGGGGYGGAGGNSSVGGGSQPGGTAYGSATTPTDLGSGGGRDDAGGTDGGDGGGSIRLIVSGAVTVTGNITTDGEAVTSTYGVGGGSGGSIYISMGTITGAGLITANGGNSTTTHGGGGGGGLVAIYRASGSAFSGTLTASGGTGANAGSAGTTTQDTAPTAPTGLSANADSSSAITWSWTDNSTNEDSFKLHDGSETVITTVTSTTEGTTGQSYSYQKTGLSANTQSTYHVHAYDAAMGNGSATSSVSKYTLANVPSAPTVDGATTSSLNVTINVNSNPAATVFAIYTSTTDQYVQADGTLGASAVWQTNATWGTVTVTGLSIGRSYTLAVKARNGDSTETALGSTASLATTANVPSAPTVSRNNATSLTVVINQNSNYSTVTYAIYNNITSTYIQADGTLGASAVWQSYTTWGGASGINNTGLSINTSYTYKVKARNADSTETAFSSNSTAIYTNANAPSAPTLSATNSTTMNVTINQNSNPSSVTYAIAAATTAGAESPQYIQANGALGASAVWQSYTTWGGASGVANTGLTENTRYYYRVKARNGDSIETSFSSEANEVTPVPAVAPTQVQAIDTSNSSYSKYSIAIQWTKDSNALRDYDILESSTNGLDYSQLTTVSSAAPGYLHVSLSSSTTYYYRIKTHLSNGDTSSASSAVSLQPASSDTTAPTISSVSSGTPASTTATITWTTNESSDSIIDYGPDTNYGSTTGDTTDALTSHSVALSGLTASSTYYYRVKSRDSAGNLQTDSNSGAGYTFATAANEANAPSGSVSIANAATYTTSGTVNLTLSSTDTGGGYVTQMKFSNNGTTYSDYETFTGLKSWDLTDTNYGGTTANGTKTIYVKFKDSYNNEATAVTDTIVFDNTAPSANTPSATTPTTDTTPTFSWTASTDTNTINGYYIKIGTTSGGAETLAETFIGNVTAYTPVSSLTDGSYYATIKAKDTPGNTGSYGSSGSVVVDATAPTAGSISIDAGALTTTDTAVDLTLSATSATYMQFANAASGTYSTWEAYATSKSSWDITSADYGGTTAEGLKTVYARFKDNAGNISSIHADSITYDATVPANGSLIIANAATYTTAATVALTINAQDENAGIYQMKFSNDGTTWSSYEAYAITKASWDLTSADYGGTTANGTKTVYARFKDNAGQETTASVNDSIVYDNTAPTANTPTVAAATTTDTTPTISWTASTDSYSINGYYIKIGTTDGGAETLAETFIGNVTAYTPVSSLADGAYYAAIKAKDTPGNTGNYSTTVSVAVDSSAPSGGSISIDAGAASTTAATVDLTLAAANASQMQFANASSGTYSTWEAYATSKASWDITSADYGGTTAEGLKTVYARFKDNAGNISSIHADSITYDATVPANGSLIIANAATYTTAATVALTINAQDENAGMYQMKFSNDGTTWSSYEAYAITKASWDLTSADYGGSTTNGTKTVYARFKDNAGKETTASITDTIVFDNTAPSANTPSATSPTTDTTPTFSWTASTDTNSINGYYIKIGTASGGTETLAETFIGNVTSYTPISSLTDGSYYATIKAKDSAGNTGSYGSSGSVTVDATGPTAGSISIDAGAASSTDSLVSLTLAATGAASMQFSNASSGTYSDWESYSTSKSSWDITSTTYGGTVTEETKAVFVRFKDSAGNISAPYYDLIGYDSTPPDVTAPTISSVASSSISATTATITYTTNEATDSYVEYGASASYGYAQGKVESATAHSVALVGLTPATTYHYRARVNDAGSNLTTSSDGTLTTSAGTVTIKTDTTSPTISSVAVASTTATGATITWTTNEASTSIVRFAATSTGPSSETAFEQGTEELVTAHSVTLIGLTNDTTYYFLVKSTDSETNSSTSAISSFTTTARAVTDSLPTIGDISIASQTAADVITNQAKITWTTSDKANSFIEYGLTTSYGTMTGQDDRVTLHSVTLEGLLANTAYHYRARSTTASGRVLISSDKTFTTASITTPSLANVNISDIGLNKATVTWKTSETASSQLLYGLTETNLSQTIGDAAASNTNHTINFTNLSPGASYYFRIKSVTAAKNELSSPTFSFATKSKPSLTAYTVGSINSKEAAINIKANKETSAQVAFGKTSNSLDDQQGSSKLQTEHKVVLKSLTQDTKYFFRIDLRDQDDNLAQSDIYTLTTKTDTDAPVISDVRSEVSQVGTGEETRIQLIVSWSTDEPAASQVDYGPGLKTGEYASQTTKDSRFNQSHTSIISNLTPSTTYHFRVKSQDEAKNQGASKDYVIVTPEQRQSIGGIILNAFEEIFVGFSEIFNFFAK